MTRAVLVAAVLLAASASARANVWDRAIDQKAPDPAAETYEKELRDGDEHVELANAKNIGFSEKKRQVRLAVQSYRNAAAAKPRAAEPHFRIGAVLYSFYLDQCDAEPPPLRDCSRPDRLDLQAAEETLTAWHAAEDRAPLDPRFSSPVSPGLPKQSILFDRAILHTKLETKAHLEAAALDYVRILERSDTEESGERIWGNLAETYMMLGRLDESIDAYGEAARRGVDTSTYYGYAVALDRDGNGTRARDLIRRVGENGYKDFRENVSRGNTFFVPVGEVFYYYALVEEAFDNHDASIQYWRRYIGSGAHPQFHPRAKEHIEALIVKRRASGRMTAPPDSLWDLR